MMAKSSRIDLEKTAKKVEGISNTVNVIMQNRLIIAIFLIVDGITFLLNPDSSLPEMAKNIILLVILAAFSVFITNLTLKEKDYRTIAVSLAIVIIGAIFYFYPDFIAAYIQLLLALFIIYDGTKNIANALNLNFLSRYTTKIAERYNKIATRKPKTEKAKKQSEKLKEVDKSLDDGLAEQKAKLVAPLQNLVGKTSKFSKLYIVANAATIVLGLVLLFYPGASMMIWGLIFFYTGASNLLAGIKAMELTKKLKARKFREIIFDAEKSDDKTTVEAEQGRESDEKGNEK